ncbi:MAG: ABC transporter permease, partial [Pseudoclavibacter sp.]|nr:ABC transporter permease [Pseudoclavibacter sp.]
AVLVLTAGIGLGVAATLGLGAAVANALPFTIDWFTILVPAAAMLLAGAAGSLVSLVQVTRADPLVALGAAAA